MPKSHSVLLPVSRKDRIYLGLSEIMRQVSQGKLRLPVGMDLQKNEPLMLVVSINNKAFSLEFDAVSISTLLPIKLTQPFLIPPNNVLSLELRRTSQSFDFFAMCSSTRTVSLAEARRLSLKKSLPPGIHNEAALVITGRVNPHVIKGGLPGLGKRR
jgi:hypothetical protein